MQTTVDTDSDLRVIEFWQTGCTETLRQLTLDDNVIDIMT